jgi:DNA-3-methyladenine glycosylase I
MVKKRCTWARSELMQAYHDNEWGVPQHDDRILFEFLILEGAQAGLSWETILKKRDNYRIAFANFEPKKVARFGAGDEKRLLADEGIVRNRLKISSAISNAKAFLDVQREFRSFDKYIWQFVGGKPIRNAIKSIRDVPARTSESDAMSKDLRKRDFASSVQRSVTRSCRRLEWSTTTRSVVSAGSRELSSEADRNVCPTTLQVARQ